MPIIGKRSMAENMIIFDPAAPAGLEPRELQRTLDGLAGKVVGFIDNAKPNFNHLVDDLAELLVGKYGVARVIKQRKRGASIPAPESMVKEISEQCDVVITGSGD
ncbi:MAG: hypothetical protein KIT18_11505 [Burkholderiales bacterium]|nr:hypothetical protein [Burkholderiales bacterium]